MKLGMQVGLAPDHIALGGDPAPQRGPVPSNFRPICLVEWIDMKLGVEVALGPCDPPAPAPLSLQPFFSRLLTAPLPLTRSAPFSAPIPLYTLTCSD